MQEFKKAYEFFEKGLKIFFKSLGPKSTIEPNKNKIYSLEKDIFYNDDFFAGALYLKEKVLNKMRKYENKINDLSTFALLKYLAKELYKIIKKRQKNINDTLEKYLTDEDISSGFSKMLDKLDNSFSEYNVYLINNLIELKDIDFIQFGNVKINKIDEKLFKKLPEKIPKYREYYKSIFAEALDEQKFLTPKQFINECKEYVALEVKVNGYQISSEISKVLEDALFEFKQIFSYFLICQICLQTSTPISRKGEVVKLKNFEVAEYENESDILNVLYIHNLNNKKDIAILRSDWIKNSLPKKKFLIDKNMEKQFMEFYQLKNFNKISSNEDYGSIRKKIRRSVDWYLKAKLESDITDKVISLFISLETLMSVGPDYLTSHTDNLADNIVLSIFDDVKARYQEKKYFKEEIYPLRNQIMHGGHSIDWEADRIKIIKLEMYLVWAIIEMIKRSDDIIKFGNNIKCIRKYFEWEKLK